MELRPTAWNINDKSDFLSVNYDGLKVEYTGKTSFMAENTAAIRANHPIPQRCKLFYFEVDIIDKGDKGCIGVGFCKKKFDLNRMPGWENSWGYHGDDGNFFYSSGIGKPYGPLFTTGDTIGCYLNLINNIIFYTKNGVHLGIAYPNEANRQNKVLKGAIYPCIGMESQGESIKVNFGHRKFKYAAITDDDINEVLNETCVSKQIADLQNNAHALRYQGKFYFVMGKYEQALKYLTKLLELEPNDPFALRYREETYYIMKNYVESIADLDKLLEININEASPVDLKELLGTNMNIAWILKAYEEVARRESECKECVQLCIPKWCQPCNSKHFENNFEKWTSKNVEIDKILQKFQLNAKSPNKVMEWIPYSRLLVKDQIGEGGFSTVYLANWLDGPIMHWDIDHQKWYRNTYHQVALKILNDSNVLLLNLLKKVEPYFQIIDNSYFIQYLGFSQDPKTCNYIIVMEFAPLGSLYTYLNDNMTWEFRMKTLLNISIGLNNLHNNDLIHQDFHPGNLLFKSAKDSLITDFGLCKPIDQSSQLHDIYGVMPYVAPEVLNGKSYTKAADIYSFGMVMYFIATGSQPFVNCAHDHNLAFQIYNGIRPEINEKVAPKCYIYLMKKCLDSNPDNRPGISEIEKLIRRFYENSKNYYTDNDDDDGNNIDDDDVNIIEDDNRKNNAKIAKQFENAEYYRRANLSPIKKKLTTHLQAIFTSQLLNPFTKDLLSVKDTNIQKDL